MRPYVVRAGDYLTRIAHRHGLSPEAIWDHPRNARLRQERVHPEMLAPGDLLFLPKAERPKHPIEPGGSHAFRASVPKVRLSVKLAAPDGRPHADCAFQVFGAGAAVIEGRTDAAGVARFDVPITVHDVKVLLPDVGIVCPVRVGYLDPPEVPSGVRQRLVNLGLLKDTPGDDREAVARALEAFQRAQKLEPTGRADDATRARLVELHGI